MPEYVQLVHAVRALTSSRVMSVDSPANSLSSVKKSIQWHSFLSRIGTHLQQKRARRTYHPSRVKYSRAVPVPIFGFGLLVFVESTRTERCPKGNFVLSQTADHDLQHKSILQHREDSGHVLMSRSVRRNTCKGSDLITDVAAEKAALRVSQLDVSIGECSHG